MRTVPKDIREQSQELLNDIFDSYWGCIGVILVYRDPRKENGRYSSILGLYRVILGFYRGYHGNCIEHSHACPVPLKNPVAV